MKIILSKPVRHTSYVVSHQGICRAKLFPFPALQHFSQDWNFLSAQEVIAFIFFGLLDISFKSLFSRKRLQRTGATHKLGHGCVYCRLSTRVWLWMHWMLVRIFKANYMHPLKMTYSRASSYSYTFVYVCMMLACISCIEICYVKTVTCI